MRVRGGCLGLGFLRRNELSSHEISLEPRQPMFGQDIQLRL
jgi:hypothetical protein